MSIKNKSKTRPLSYTLAINEAFHQTMAADPGVILIGQGVKSPWYVGNTARGLLERFGKERIIDTPVSENGITAAAVGAAIAGLKPIVVHPRVDFMMYAIDPIINQAAKWHYMFGGEAHVPVVIWGIINRGGEQGAQHSQAMQALFAHVPGLKVVMPATSYDAKGLMIAAINDPNPVVYIDDRWLYGNQDHVPEEMYEVPIGKGLIKRPGTDVTLVAISFMVKEALAAAEILAKQKISVEVIDPRSLKPFDEKLVAKSLRKTGRLVVADTGWWTGGVAADIIARMTERYFKYLKVPPRRVTLPDIPAPTSRSLEKVYYRYAKDIVKTVQEMVKK